MARKFIFSNVFEGIRDNTGVAENVTPDYQFPMRYADGGKVDDNRNKLGTVKGINIPITDIMTPNNIQNFNYNLQQPIVQQDNTTTNKLSDVSPIDEDKRIAQRNEEIKLANAIAEAEYKQGKSQVYKTPKAGESSGYIEPKGDHRWYTTGMYGQTLKPETWLDAATIATLPFDIAALPGLAIKGARGLGRLATKEMYNMGLKQSPKVIEDAFPITTTTKNSGYMFPKVKPKKVIHEANLYHDDSWIAKKYIDDFLSSNNIKISELPQSKLVNSSEGYDWILPEGVTHDMLNEYARLHHSIKETPEFNRVRDAINNINKNSGIRLVTSHDLHGVASNIHPNNLWGHTTTSSRAVMNNVNANMTVIPKQLLKSSSKEINRNLTDLEFLKDYLSPYGYNILDNLMDIPKSILKDRPHYVTEDGFKIKTEGTTAETRLADEAVMNHFDNLETQQKFIDYGGTKDAYKQVLQNIEPKTLTTYNTPNGAMGIATNNRAFVWDSPYASLRTPEHKAMVKQTGVHEKYHLTNIVGRTREESMLPKLYDDIAELSNIAKYVDEPGSISHYIRSPFEIYSRIGELRDIAKLKPGEKFTEHSLEKAMGVTRDKTGKIKSIKIMIPQYPQNKSKWLKLINKAPIIAAPIGIGTAISTNKE